MQIAFCMGNLYRLYNYYVFLNTARGSCNKGAGDAANEPRKETKARGKESRPGLFSQTQTKETGEQSCLVFEPYCLQTRILPTVMETLSNVVLLVILLIFDLAAVECSHSVSLQSLIIIYMYYGYRCF